MLHFLGHAVYNCHQLMSLHSADMMAADFQGKGHHEARFCGRFGSSVYTFVFERCGYGGS